MIIPVLKLGTLAIRTISKPIANRLKMEAVLHPKFLEFIINTAQANHRFSTNMQRPIYGRATNVLIRPLDEEKAIQAAADLLGEFFFFTALKQKGKDLEKEVELLKHKLLEVEQLSRGGSLLNHFKLWHAQASQAHES